MRPCVGCGNYPSFCTCGMRKLAGMDVNKLHDPETEPDWDHECDNCGGTPIVPATGLCGPCTFGEADTAGGNW